MKKITLTKKKSPKKVTISVKKTFKGNPRRKNLV